MAERLKRAFFVVAGSVLVGIGVIGIVVPLLPTTPFLLLAAICYAKSSQRLHRALLTNRFLGSYISNYIAGRGMTRRAKMWTLGLLWIGIGLSAALATDSSIVRIGLGVILIGVTLHILSVSSPHTDIAPHSSTETE
ncbi:MAG: YbaN family protein [Chloroflexota bacterium]